MLCFELTMPNVGSWDGKWSGEGKKYLAFRRVNKTQGADLPGKNFYYSFGDGWGANIKVTKIDSKDRRKLEKKSGGFCGYEWMIDEILEYGRILTLEERNDLRLLP